MRNHVRNLFHFLVFFSVSCIASIEIPEIIEDISPTNKAFPTFQENVVSSTESLSDVASVSKFIKEFHKQFEDELVPEADGNKEDTVEPVAVVEPSVTVDSSNSTNSSASHVNCLVSPNSPSSTVELINSTRLHSLLNINANITNRITPAECTVILFYAKTCPFSVMAGPHFNALPRAFPTIKMAALNALKHQSHNTQFGIISIPTLLLFHNGRPVAKFNSSEFTLDSFAKFIHRLTGIAPKKKMFVSSADFGGPVPSMPEKEVDNYLILAWIVIIVALGLGFQKSRWWQLLVEACKNSWREAEAQHEHTE